MRASLLVGPETSEVREVPVPPVGEDGVLVRVEACGVCFSEFPKWRGAREGLTYPTMMGHEPSGVIEKIGQSVDSLKVGQRVAVLPTGGPAGGRPGSHPVPHRRADTA
jgi:L-iditol 2-dehydrogenase